MGKKLMVMVGVLVLVAAMSPGLAWAQKEPIKIGFLAPMTGGAAQVGKDMVKTVMKFLNGTVVAKIKDGNKASEKIALSAGFVKTGSAQGFSIWTIDTAARLQSRAE